jgi:hypothetical protein
MKQITIKTDNKEYIFDVFKNDNTGRSFVLKNKKYIFVYSYNTLVYGENTQKKNFFANYYTDYSATTRKHIYNAISPFVSELWETEGLKTKNGNSKETLIKFICRCGENMPYFMPEKLNLKNIEFEFTRWGGKFVKSIKKGII